MKNIFLVSLIASLFFSSFSYGKDMVMPSNREILAVQNFFLDGNVPVPILVDLQLCSDVPKKGENKFNCENPLDEKLLTPGDQFYVWMNYLVPDGQDGKVLVQLNQSGITHLAKTLPIKSSLRYRTWVKMSLPEKGTWEVPIYLRARNEMKEITTLTLNVM